MGGHHAGHVAFARTRFGLAAGVIVDWDETRGHVLLADGRREVWTQDRLVWMSEARVPLHSEAAARQALSGFCERVRAVQVDLASLWELVVTEGGEWSIADLADLAFPRASCEHRAAIACALAQDQVFFRPGQERGRVTPYSPAAVEQARLRREREQQEEALLARVGEAVREGIWPSGEGASPVRDDHALGMGKEWLKALVLAGEDDGAGARGARLVRRVLGEEVREPAPVAFDWLVRLGVFSEDEVLGLHRHRIAVEFPAEVEEEAARIAASWEETCSGMERPTLAPQDGTAGPVAVDDPWTTEVDDALWVEGVEDAGSTRTRVHVLIADPSSGIPLDSRVALEGMARAATLYLPDRKVPMFPRILSEGLFSLVPGQRRPMMDFTGEFDANGNLLSFNITPVIGALERRLTYDEVDAILASEDAATPLARSLRVLDRLAQALRRRREEAGAVVVDRDDVTVRVVDGEIRVRRVPGHSRARRLVAEFMVFACTQAGRFAREHGVPVVYRRQGPPDNEVPPDLVRGSKAWAYRMVRLMKRAEMSVHPEPHFGLGVTGYTQVTSPLRRFQDFVVHAQIKGFLCHGRAPLDAAQILAMFGDLEERAEARVQVEREARRYFLLKYLASFLGSEVAGEVVAVQGNRAVVELLETGLEVFVQGAGRLPLGAEVRLKVLEVHPRRDRLLVRLA